jgi:hypothetical protein
MYHKLLLINLQFYDGISGLGYIAMSNRVITNNESETVWKSLVKSHFSRYVFNQSLYVKATVGARIAQSV